MKTQHKREHFYSHLTDKKDYKVVEKRGVEAHMYTTDNGRVAMTVFVGRAQKPAFHHVYSNEDQRQRRFDDLVNTLVQREEEKERRRKEANQPHTLKLGDIMYCSWGYEQTNISWYEVTKIVGTKMIEARRINGTFEYVDGSSYGITAPVKGSYREDAKRYKVNMSGNSPSIAVYSFASAYLWDGETMSETAPGYGH